MYGHVDFFLGHFEFLNCLRLFNLDNDDDLWNFALYLILDIVG